MYCCAISRQLNPIKSIKMFKIPETRRKKGKIADDKGWDINDELKLCKSNDLRFKHKLMPCIKSSKDPFNDWTKLCKT